MTENPDNLLDILKNEYKGLLKGCVILTHNIALVEHIDRYVCS